MPVEATLAATLAMSQGARNWPFLTLIARRFRRRQATGRSGGRGTPGSAAHRRPAATAAHWASVWTSVSTGTPNSRRMSDRIVSPSSMPNAAPALERGAVGLVDRLDLKINGTPVAAADLATVARDHLGMVERFRSGRGRRSTRSGRSLPTVPRRRSRLSSCRHLFAQDRGGHRDHQVDSHQHEKGQRSCSSKTRG